MQRRIYWSVVGGFFGTVAICTTVMVATVDAGPREPHNTVYFLTHPTERARVMKWCLIDSRNADTYECRNAIAADWRADSRVR